MSHRYNLRSHSGFSENLSENLESSLGNQSPVSDLSETDQQPLEEEGRSQPTNPVHERTDNQENNMAAEVNFVMNPYLGNINPGTSDGLKLYLKATEKREPQLTVSQENVKYLMPAFEADARNFGWGPLVNVVPVSTTAGDTKSILHNFKEITLEHVKKAAHKRWMISN